MSVNELIIARVVYVKLKWEVLESKGLHEWRTKTFCEGLGLPEHWTYTSGEVESCIRVGPKLPAEVKIAWVLKTTGMRLSLKNGLRMDFCEGVNWVSIEHILLWRLITKVVILHGCSNHIDYIWCKRDEVNEMTLKWCVKIFHEIIF